jgi:acetylornithine/succinyldiaminopimelate/putrescine aminotransferase
MIAEDETQIHNPPGFQINRGLLQEFERGLDPRSPGNSRIPKREGVYVWDRAGRKLIDCHCNGGVFNLGHRHPRVVAALRHALDEFDIGNHHLMSEPRARLAERLASLSPGDLDRVVFGGYF